MERFFNILGTIIKKIIFFILWILFYILFFISKGLKYIFEQVCIFIGYIDDGVENKRNDLYAMTFSKNDSNDNVNFDVHDND